MNRYFTLTCLILRTLTTPISNGSEEAAQAEATHHYQRDLKSVSETKEGVHYFDLDAHIYEHCQADLADLRLIKTNDEELVTAFQIEKVAATVHHQPSQRISTKTTSVKTNSDNSIEITIHLDQPPNQPQLNAASLTIRTALQDFEKTIHTSGSNDQNHWTTLVSDGVVFDRSSFIDFRSTRLDLPENQFRYFKVKIDAVNERQKRLVGEIVRLNNPPTEPHRIDQERLVTNRIFKVDQIDFYTAYHHPETQSPNETAYPTIIDSVTQNRENQTTELIIHAHQAPLHRLQLHTNDKNFRRKVRIQVEKKLSNSNQVRWQTIANEYVHRYAIADFENEALQINLAEHNHNRYRIVIANNDNPQLTIDQVSGYGPILRAYYLAQANDRWAVRYGTTPDSPSPKPIYDTSAIRAAKIAHIPLVENRLGAPTASTTYSKQAPRATLLWTHPLIINSLIISSGLILLCLIVRVAKQVDQTS